ncbi:MAG TPA: hypothetical protein VHH73_12630, partial [Verrucomicrobiae bacterium]|nr:hypothetical protein [Verrucomicrobiae bacterium]
MRNCKCLFLWAILCTTTLYGQTRQQWVSLYGNSRPGTPVEAVAVKTSAQNTTYELHVPGLWMETISYAGKSFVRLELPAVQLSGEGFPKKTGERGWYDFPAETGQPLRDPAPFVNAFSIGIPQSIFPAAAVNQKPRTAA